jgi:hypothetical protein
MKKRSASVYAKLAVPLVPPIQGIKEKSRGSSDKFSIMNVLQSPTALAILGLLLLSLLLRDVVHDHRSRRPHNPDNTLIRLGFNRRRLVSHPDEIVLPPPVRQAKIKQDFCNE